MFGKVIEMITPAATMLDEHTLVDAVLAFFPTVEAIYLFGSFADASANADSDIDLALLLPPHEAKLQQKNLLLHPLHQTLEQMTGRDVDLVNLRMVPTVFQKEVVMAGSRIYCTDELVGDQFDVSVLSGYQKLNEERADILQQFKSTGRAYDV